MLPVATVDARSIAPDGALLRRLCTESKTEIARNAERQAMPA